MIELPNAEDIRYWKTGKSSPDTWIEKTIKLIEDLGGNVISHAYGKDPASGKRAYMFFFEIEGFQFKVVQRVLDSKYQGSELAEKRQATTLMHHEIKAKCLSMMIKGARTAFFEYLLLPDGRTASEASFPELMQDVPQIIMEIGKQAEMVEIEYHDGD